jgi:hypothetical protein
VPAQWRQTGTALKQPETVSSEDKIEQKETK